MCRIPLSKEVVGYVISLVIELLSEALDLIPELQSAMYESINLIRQLNF